MIHICSICGRTIDCREDCDRPAILPMNCGINTGHPHHPEEYLKAIKVKVG